jgi:hypothetical protein
MFSGGIFLDKNMRHRWGGYTFLLGVAVSVVAGLATPVIDYATAGTVTVTLAILGIIMGLMVFEKRNASEFLIAAIALAVGMASFGIMPLNKLVPAFSMGTMLTGIVWNVTTLIAPAAVLVSMRIVWEMATTTTKER